MKNEVKHVYDSSVFLLIAVVCVAFLPDVTRSRLKTISGVRRKKPMSRFQLMAHLQCCKPENCCFIFLPQLGQILLFMPLSDFCQPVHQIQYLDPFVVADPASGRSSRNYPVWPGGKPFPTRRWFRSAYRR